MSAILVLVLTFISLIIKLFHSIIVAKSELMKFENAIDKLYRSIDCSAFKFERAVRTQVSISDDYCREEEDKDKDNGKEKM